MEHLHSRRGFTLIELLVVLAIILVLTAITITSQTSFNKTLVLSNTAYDIALAIRSAENFGLGSRGGGAVTVGSNIGYGVHFESATPGSFTLFADTSPAPSASNCHGLPVNGASAPDAQWGDCIYTAGSDTKINDYTLGNGIKVNDFCLLYTGTIWICSVNTPSSMLPWFTNLDIVFSRPNSDVFLKGLSAFGGEWSGTEACLSVTSPQGGFRYIAVEKSGEINANASSCPLP